MPVYPIEERARKLAEEISSLVSPQEAEAFPLGKVVGKAAAAGAKKLAKGLLKSRAHKTLVGRVIRNKAVKEVVKGEGAWRYVVFEDGSYIPMTSDYVELLARRFGTIDKMAELATKSEEGKVTQALISLDRHLSHAGKKYSWQRGHPFIREYSKEYIQKVREVDPRLTPDLVHVSAHNPAMDRIEYFQMPREYAEILETINRVKIERSTKIQRDIDKWFKD